MPSIDPLRLLYRFYNLVNVLGRLLLKPFGFVPRLVLGMRRTIEGSTRLDRMGDWSLVRGFRRWLFWLGAMPNKVLGSSVSKRTASIDPFNTRRNALGFLFRTSLVEPFKWMVQIAGVAYRWIRSRGWGKVIVYSMPSAVLVACIALDWYGGRISRNQLAHWYMELGNNELEKWGQTFVATEDADISAVGVEKIALNLSGDESPETGNANKIPEYSELLFRRINLLKRNSEYSNFIIGYSMFKRGAVEEAKKVLRRIGPDNDVRYLPAHGLMACILLKEMAVNTDPTLLPTFQHHATIAYRWPYLPADVLLAASELHRMTGNQDMAFRMLNVASESQPEIFLLYYERAKEAGLDSLAENVRERGIRRIENILRQDPRNEYARVCLAALLQARSDGFESAQKLLLDGTAMNPSPLLNRGLSELYLKRFNQKRDEGADNAELVMLLDQAMAMDPCNPSVSESAETWMKSDLLAEDKIAIGQTLNRFLVAGDATTGTHALLAEHYLNNDESAKATTHLEQVYRVAPTAARYSKLLANIYVTRGRWSEAKAVCDTALSLLAKRNLLRERYVDDLLDTLGVIHQQQSNPDEAISVFELCISLSPNRPETRQKLANLYRQVGKESQALEQERLAKSTAITVEKQQAFVQALTDPGAFLNPGVAGIESPVMTEYQTLPQGDGERPSPERVINTQTNDGESPSSSL